MATGPEPIGKKEMKSNRTAHDLHGKPRRNSDLNIKAKLGIVSALAAVLIGFAVFGLGHTEVKADVTAGNVWIMPTHSSPISSCGAATSTAGADPTTGGWQVNTTNFPPAVVS